MPHEDADLAAEAATLCLLVEKHARALRGAEHGRRFRIDGVSFRLFGRARNTIYRLSARSDWYLKLPTDGTVDPIVRERLGADTIARALRGDASYGGASVIRVSSDPPYVLSSTIPGKQLNKVLFTECWIPSPRAAARLEETFGTLGSLLARLHGRASVMADAPGASTRPFRTLDRMLERVKGPDVVTAAIAGWQHDHRCSDEGPSFVHGNLRMDNVIVTESRLGFLDFENCGTGSPCQDLSRPVSELLATRCLIPFPHARIQRCVAALLDAYGRTAPYERDELRDFVGVRVARYYLEARARRFRVTIGGIPLLRSRLDRLTLAVLRDGFDRVIPGLRI